MAAVPLVRSPSFRPMSFGESEGIPPVDRECVEFVERFGSVSTAQAAPSYVVSRRSLSCHSRSTIRPPAPPIRLPRLAYVEFGVDWRTTVRWSTSDSTGTSWTSLNYSGIASDLHWRFPKLVSGKILSRVGVPEAFHTAALRGAVFRTSRGTCDVLAQYLRRVSTVRRFPFALDSAGHDVTIAEQSAGDLRSRGGGIVVQQSIRQFLSRHDIVDPASITTRASERRFRPLTAMWNVDAGFNGVTSRRRLSSLRAAFPDDRYHTGQTVTGVRAADGTVTFSAGTGPPPIWTSLPTAGSLQPVRNCLPTPTRSLPTTSLAWCRLRRGATALSSTLGSFSG